MQFSPLLVVHISGGLTGILSGAAALVFRKGSPRHIVSGKVFVVAMLSMSATGAYMAYFIKPNMGNVIGGIMTFYLVATAWATARRKNGETRAFDWGALLAAFATGVALIIFGFQAMNSPSGLKEGYPPAVYFVWASLALLSAAGDVRMLARGGAFVGAQRIVRHLWRMCFALFIAAGSFFLGKQNDFPASLRGLKVWYVLAFLPLILMIFWLFRVRFSGASERKSISPGPAASRLRTSLRA